MMAFFFKVIHLFKPLNASKLDSAIHNATFLLTIPSYFLVSYVALQMTFCLKGIVSLLQRKLCFGMYGSMKLPAEHQRGVCFSN